MGLLEEIVTLPLSGMFRENSRLKAIAFLLEHADELESIKNAINQTLEGSLFLINWYNRESKNLFAYMKPDDNNN